MSDVYIVVSKLHQCMATSQMTSPFKVAYALPGNKIC